VLNIKGDNVDDDNEWLIINHHHKNLQQECFSLCFVVLNTVY